MKKIEDLRWVRIFTVEHLPHYLIEQVRNRNYSIEDFFKYHQLNLLIQNENGITLNPFNHLYVLVDPENLVKGFLWFTVDPLTKDIFIQTYSVDKEYWGRGYAVRKLTSHIKEILKKACLNKVFWANPYPKHSMRYGFRHSKNILMEYDPKEEVKENKIIDINPKDKIAEKEELIKQGV